MRGGLKTAGQILIVLLIGFPIAVILTIINLIVALPSFGKKLVLGHPKNNCWNCGSHNISIRGFKEHNRRYVCCDCGHVTVEDE